jgi:hypothetical protein
MASDGSWSWGWGEAVLALLGLLLAVPLFFFVTTKGHPPRWWTSIEEMIDIERALCRHLKNRNRK